MDAKALKSQAISRPMQCHPIGVSKWLRSMAEAAQEKALHLEGKLLSPDIEDCDEATIWCIEREAEVWRMVESEYRTCLGKEEGR